MTGADRVPPAPPEGPDLYRAAVTVDGLAAVFRDIEEHARVQSVSFKSAATSMARDATPSLAEALERVRGGTLRGVQIRYRYEEEDWLDTVIVRPGRDLELLRMRCPTE